MVRRQSISVLLMVIAILLIIAFQVYWLNKTYREEAAGLKARTGFIFRETLFRLQGAKLKLDSGTHIRVGGRRNMSTIVNVLRVRADSLRRKMERTVIFRDRQFVDSNNIRNTSNDRIFNILLEVDSLQDTLTVKEIETAFREALDQQQLTVHFLISRNDVSADTMQPFEEDRVVMGFKQPVAFGFTLVDEEPYLYRQISSQLLFSFFLVGVTMVSFITMYRSLRTQQNLTELKNDFISNITHELKTPIATVSVAIEAMKNFNIIEDRKRSIEYLDICSGELQRLSLLVDKVLRLSMFEKEEIQLNKQRFDLKQLVDEVITTLRLQIEKQHAQVHLELSGNDFQLIADRLHITSVLYNLLDNALKYSTDKPVIRIHLERVANEIIVRVTDNGRGIPAEYREKIFEKFFRVPEGDTHNVKGYGLGLSYVAYVIKKHEGSIDVHSHPGKGSTFTLKLPVVNG